MVVVVSIKIGCCWDSQEIAHITDSYILSPYLQ